MELKSFYCPLMAGCLLLFCAFNVCAQRSNDASEPDLGVQTRIEGQVSKPVARRPSAVMPAINFDSEKLDQRKMTPSERAAFAEMDQFTEKCNKRVIVEVLRIVSSHPTIDKSISIPLLDILPVSMIADLERAKAVIFQVKTSKRHAKRIQLYNEWLLAAEQFYYNYDLFNMRFVKSIAANTEADEEEENSDSVQKAARRLTYEDLKKMPDFAKKVLAYMVRSPYLSYDFEELAHDAVFKYQSWKDPGAYTDLKALQSDMNKLEQCAKDIGKIKSTATPTAARNILSLKKKQIELELSIALLRDQLVENSPRLRDEMLKRAADIEGFLFDDQLFIMPESKGLYENAMVKAGRDYPHLLERREHLFVPLLEQVADLQRVGDMITIRIGQTTEAENRTKNTLDTLIVRSRLQFWESELQDGYERLLAAWETLKAAHLRAMGAVMRSKST